MRLIYVNNSKVTKLEQEINNPESFLLLLKNLLKCTYEVLLPSQRYVRIRLRQLHLIFDKFSIELFPLIYVKSTFIKVNGWNFINVQYMLWYM